MIDTAIYEILTDDSAVSAIVDEAVYPAMPPQDVTLPYITYQQVSGIPYRALNGPSDYCKSRFQVDCWAATPLAAKTLAAAAKAALQEFYGPKSGIRIGEVILNDQRDNFNPPQDGSDQIVPGVTLDFTILHGD